MIRMIFCGDLVPTEATRPAFDRGDLNALMGDVPSFLRGSDFAVANLEGALTLRDTPIRKIGSLQKGVPDDARVIAACGFTHIGLSNNHTLDYGVNGMRDTVEAVRAAGMVPFGYGENDLDSRKNLILEKDGKRIAVVAVCEHEYTYALPDQFGANPFDPFDTMEDVAEAKRNADAVIVMYHGGKEQCEYPSPRLRRACRAMVRAGADLVLTQHSHCIGSRETYRGAEILYGQGNFNFVEEPENPQWRCGLMAEVLFDGALRVDYIPVTVTDTGIRLALPAEKQNILDGLTRRSATLQDDKAWMEAWEAFCRSVPYYVDAVKNAFRDVPEGEQCNQIFPHYLDCEAHLDVWHTLFKSWHGSKTSGAVTEKGQNTMERKVNIAIDGPSGAGKSTSAKAAARALGFIYVDTGALYRAVGVAALKREIPTSDAKRVADMLPELTIELRFEDGEQKVYLNGEDVSKTIRLPEASMAASDVSAVPAVRAFLFDLQKDLAKHNDCIMDGRDIGTVVLPDAQLKIFLTASPEERANRRYKELLERGTPVDYNVLLEEIIQRDYNDSHRAIAPLKPADDAVIIDSSDMDFETVVAKIVSLAKEVIDG